VLRFFNAKVAPSRSCPLERAAEAIGASRRRLQNLARMLWLSSDEGEPDGARPFTYNALRQRLFRFQEAIDLRDRNGRPVRVTAHQFRTPLAHALSIAVCRSTSSSV